MGAHLTDAVYIPWVQMFFPDKVLIESYKELVHDLPDGEERIKFRISKNKKGEEYFSYINKMTLKRFKTILNALDITPEYYSEEPLRGFLAPAAKTALFKEMLVKMAVCVLKKD